MSSPKTVQIQNDGGETKEYKLFSARLPEFRKKYPIEEGYLVKVTRSEYITEQSTLLALYKKCVEEGVKPSDMGIPSLTLSDFRQVVFTATLFGPDGNELEKATAIGVADTMKSWEKAETAARQRLIAALGFGGDVFDEDEKEMIADMNNSASAEVVQFKSAPTNSEKTKGELKTVQPSQKQENGQERQEEQPGLNLDGDIGDEAIQPSEPEEQEDTNSEVTESGDQGKEPSANEAVLSIPPHMLNQIRQYEDLKGVDAYTPASTQEAKAYLKKLIKLQKED